MKYVKIYTDTRIFLGSLICTFWRDFWKNLYWLMIFSCLQKWGGVRKFLGHQGFCTTCGLFMSFAELAYETFGKNLCKLQSSHCQYFWIFWTSKQSQVSPWHIANKLVFFWWFQVKLYKSKEEPCLYLGRCEMWYVLHRYVRYVLRNKRTHVAIFCSLVPFRPTSG